ncbi:glutamine-hydrolyzing carbamoyl-phosphate synthase small subunit [Helcobacillus sp. ACRRO]|uniref:glutamine-hydrolyzing carbamoyl-phosphate synthase small subunit n=1 Tax=Helcobacillus sp. ACRRO TaxID=2918202 RepID=UPI001EF730D9|nr:glutamine-hydrolyzing carbamoyl-phosphate synthase small subunit [Helcobacillus sp. ACRRO]MCG7426453.1 glutamine-hydrolyzing carbamoyl-phosphate synthase small subunit [Helcobacillus sp. ACRRO]
MTRDGALLILEDGTVFRGDAYGARGTTLGEVVFTTGMTGYQETLTDPSYTGQIVVQTAPHIGNTGTNAEDMESSRIWAAGYVVRDAARRTSNWRSEKPLVDALTDAGIVGIAGIDTRALTRRLRESGAMRGGIFSGPALDQADEAALLEQVRTAPTMEGASFVDEVTTREAYIIPAEGEKIGTVAALDLGIKSATPRHMAARGLDVHVLPAASGIEDILAISPDAVFFSNGPGDPATADEQVEVLREVLRRGLPFFGICFGNQLLGRALGFGTYKLKYGHRGINQPVQRLSTGQVEITSHNHGFAVDAPIGEAVTAPHNDGEFGRVRVSHVCLNDDVVEGLHLEDRPAFSVQYHPESASGPHDANYLFDALVDMIRTHRAGKDS